MLVLSACTAAGTPVPTSPPTQAPSSAGPSSAASAAPTELPGTKQFVVAKPAPSIANIPFHAAMEDMNKAGYNVTVQSIDTPELLIEGVAKGQFAFGDGSINLVMNAVLKGAEIRVISDRVGNEWSLYTQAALNNCADLAGKNLGVTSLGSSVTAMLKAWITKTCPGTTPNYLVISTSDQRALALIANQIDAAPLQIQDGLPLMNNAEHKGKFKILTNFQRDLPELLINSVYVNNEFARQNPGTVVAVMKALLEANRKVLSEPNFLREVTLRYLPNIDQTSLDQIVAAYKEFKLFDPNGGATTEKLQFTAKFYGPAPEGTGSVPQVLNPSQWADLTYLNLALGQLGRQ
jgi:ABC-type nitrate/sulfonate/bicarbonate transport system substrate-binding protein